MEFANIEFLADGAPSSLALTWEQEERTAPLAEAPAIPVMKRQGGLLLAIPSGFLALSALEGGEESDPHALVGPYQQLRVPFGVLDEQGLEVPLDTEGPVVLLDLSLGVLPLLREAAEDLGSEELFPFVIGQPEAMPLSDELLAAAHQWLTETTANRAAFYSALEEPAVVAEEVLPKAKAKKAAAAKRKVTNAELAAQLSDLSKVLPQLAGQLAELRKRQDALEAAPQASPPGLTPAHQQSFLGALPKGPGLPLAKQAQLIGPPPRVRPEAQACSGQQAASASLGQDLPPAPEPSDVFQAAVLQQSQALSALVGHLVAQQEGGLGDLATSASSAIGAKGAAKREKLQNALSTRSGEFFLQVVQAAHKRLHPATPCPASLDAFTESALMCQYLERYGGFAGQREQGYAMWCLAHVMDAMIQQDYQGAQEFLALTFVAMDQSSIDGGRWDFAWLLTLLEEPPPQLFHGRGTVANPRTRAFSPLSPVAWTTCALQYLKEVDLITARRLETLGNAPRGSQHPPQLHQPASSEIAPADQNKPKRPPRYPRKPKADLSK